MNVGRNSTHSPAKVAEPRFARLRFYSVGWVFSMMLGNFFLASLDAVATSPVTAAKAPASADTELINAHDAFTRHDARALDAARVRLAQAAPDHLLAPYMNYWALSVRLLQPQAKVLDMNAEIGSFLAANAATGFSETLRRDWLRALGDANAAAEFTKAYSSYTGDDPDITCHQLRFRLAAGDREALTEAKAMWKEAQSVPLTCYDVFQKVVAANLLTVDEQWERVRNLFDRNHSTDARRSAAFIKDVPASFERESLAVHVDPAKFLTREKLRSKDRASVTVFLFALSRLARSNVMRAASWLEQNGDTLPAADRARAWAEVGHYAAMQHDPEALTYFARADAHALADQQAAWKARAALRQGDWRAVQNAIGQMSAAERAESAWRYWHARADVEQGRADAARLPREALAREHHFYGILTAEELGTLPAPQWPGFRPMAAEREAVRDRPGIRRALALAKLGLRRDALREWAVATRGMSDQELLAAAAAASEANVIDRAIQAADRTLTLHDFSQRYPLPHRAELSAEAKVHGLDEAWVYGLIRQESRFQADVRSHVGAAGLMQLMPATAAWTAKRVGIKNFAPHTVTEIPVNLRLGSYYLRHVLDQLGHPVLATAAYNAGPNRAKRWQAARALEGAIYAESIPFNETRDYVKKVMVNAWYYQHQLGTPKPSLKALMGTIAGRNGVGSAAANAATTAVALAAP